VKAGGTHPRVSVNPVCTVSNSLEDDFRLYQRLGVVRCGLHTTKLEAYGWDRAVAAVRMAGLEIPYVVHGIYTSVTDGEGWRREQDLLLHSVETAVQVGAGCVYMCVGPSGGLLWEEAAGQFCNRVGSVKAAADQAQVALAIENGHTSRPELGFIHSVGEAVALAHQVGPGTGICVDLYCCWQERSLFETIRRNLSLVQLVQVSDFTLGGLMQPDRRVPGDGDLPIPHLIERLLTTGYSGPVDLELLGPAIEEEGYEPALTRGVRWLSNCLGRLDLSPDSTESP
jgi:sugar phosphate isomerase/epimerase